MLDLFEIAAFRCGWLAARAGAPHSENPFTRGPLARFERQWDRGWSAHVERACELAFIPKNSDCLEAFHA
ncbi:hypothetical protein [Cupriavidus alkaliphilus]|uniref:hypothetical protein n=1 Tax=Cupriavidus alkaliphilus TaxID=942866 RepID=UPI0016161CDF|nr:hypothetical protein [Cupriavidus alkaliphilus]MBB2918307.1 hypothetical protein [Cupriavidus alkaliphilus]